MPHLIIEYSDNLESVLTMEDLVRDLHAAAVAQEALPTGGIRTRAVPRSLYQVADGDATNGFIYVTLRIGRGRPPETQEQIGEALFAALNRAVEPVFAGRPLSLGLEIQEIDPATRWKRSNIREYMAARGRPAGDTP